MSSPPEAPATDPGPPPAPEGVSAFVAKVLDQLSLSAWLPAALLTASLTLLLQFRWQRSVDLSTALQAIEKNWVVVLLLAVPVLVLATLATQAFSFGAIRVLEGYWMRRRPTRWLRSMLIRQHVRRWLALEEKARRYARQAFDNAESRWADEPTEVLVAMWAQARGRALAPVADPDLAHRLSLLNWRTECDPWDLAKLDDAQDAAAEYPEQSRILPTRLGNLLRATEDELVGDRAENLVTFVMRRRHLLSQRVQLQHDQFRTRLDMYCTLVFVAVALAALTAVLLAGVVDWVVTILLAAGFLALALVSYIAALASARGYCTILRLMKDVAVPAEPGTGEPRD